MEDNFTPELIEKAKQAKSREELLALAKENGVELSEEKANEYFERLNNSGELSDEELDNVSGGGCYYKDGRLVVTAWYLCKRYECKFCGRKGGTSATSSETASLRHARNVNTKPTRGRVCCAITP